MKEPNRRWLFFDSLSKTQSNPVSTEDAQLTILKMSEKDTERFFIWTAGWEKWQPLKAYLTSKQKIFFSSLQSEIKHSTREETVTSDNTVKAAEREVLEVKPLGKQTKEETTKSSFNASLTKTNHFSYISLKEEDIEPNQDTSQFESKFNGDELTLSTIQKPKIDFKSLNAKGLKDRSDRHELKIEILLITPKGKTFRSRSQNISMSGSLLEDNIPFEYSEKSFDIVVINTQPCDPKFQRVSLRAKTVGEGLTQRIHYVQMTPQQKKSLQNLLENYLQIQENHKKKAG